MWLLFPVCVMTSYWLFVAFCWQFDFCCCFLVLHCCKHMRLSCALNHLLTYLLSYADVIRILTIRKLPGIPLTRTIIHFLFFLHPAQVFYTLVFLVVLDHNEWESKHSPSKKNIIFLYGEEMLLYQWSDRPYSRCYRKFGISLKTIINFVINFPNVNKTHCAAPQFATERFA